MISFVITASNLAIGFCLGLAFGSVAPLFVSGQTKLGIIFGALIVGCVFSVWLVEGLGDLLTRMLVNVMWAPKAPALSGNVKARTHYWIGAGLCAGLLACTFWEPSDILKAIHAI